jgi:hypothetical protein
VIARLKVEEKLKKQDGDWWIGWIEAVPGTNCQEALEFNRQEANAQEIKKWRQ